MFSMLQSIDVGTDPLKDNLPLLKSEPIDDTPEASNTAKLVNELSVAIQQALEKHPINDERRKQGKPVANVVLLRGCGTLIEAPKFQEKHGLTPFLIAPTCIIAGLAMSLGIDIIKAPGATGDYHTNLNSKAETLIKEMTRDDSKYTFGFIHVKAVDDAGHDRNVGLKVRFLQEIDAMIALLLQNLSEDEKWGKRQFSICVTGDHSTPVLSGDHSYEPVPFSIAKVRGAHEYFRRHSGVGGGIRAGSNNIADDVVAFSEIDNARGVLGRFCGSQVIHIIKKFIVL